jgi:competence protein ComEA
MAATQNAFKGRAAATGSARRSLSVALRLSCLFTLGTALTYADLPDGPGKAATIRVCGRCHSAERVSSLHQGRGAWEDTIVKMMKLGATGSDEELEAVLNYLSTHFSPETPGPVNINTARAVDLEAALLLRRSQAEAVIAYRKEHGAFHSMDDLAQVPGLDIKPIQAKKSRVVF